MTRDGVRGVTPQAGATSKETVEGCLMIINAKIILPEGVILDMLGWSDEKYAFTMHNIQIDTGGAPGVVGIHPWETNDQINDR